MELTRARFIRPEKEFDRPQFLADWKLPEQCPLVGTVGEFTPFKGQQEFLRAATQILQDKTRLPILLSPASITRLMARKSKRGSESLIDELKFAERGQTGKWLHAGSDAIVLRFDVFVSASQPVIFRTSQ